MSKNFYGAYALTGGATGALDAIDGAGLVDKDGALVITQAGFYIYALDVDSAAAESSPDVISPDTNAGDKRWILQSVYADNLAVTGGQIVFPASAVPSSDPNTLDDYEEGEYDATLTCGTSGTITLESANNVLAYTKIGRQVAIQGALVVNSVSSPVGDLRVSIPFTSAALTETADATISAVGYNSITALDAPGTLFTWLLTGADFAAIRELTTTGLLTDVSAHIKATTDLRFGFTYVT